MTKTPDKNCPHCGGTGLTLLMEDCLCSADGFITITPEDWDNPSSPQVAEVVAAFTEEEEEAKPVETTLVGGTAASGAQVDLIGRLVAERDAKDPTVAFAASKLTSGLSKRGASLLIDKLMKIPATKPKIRPNSYPGQCAECGGPVDVGKGRIEKMETGLAKGKWVTYHLDGDCLSAEEKEAAAADQVTEPGIYRRAGAYYRVRRGRYDKSAFWAEKIHISETQVSFSRAGRATFLRASDRLGWKEAHDLGIAYNACINCGKSLSDPQSVVAGYGERCSETCGWPYPNAKTAKAVLAGEATWDE